MQNMQKVQICKIFPSTFFFSTKKCFPSPNTFLLFLLQIFSSISFSFYVFHLINQNVMKSKVQCPDSISWTCLAQKFGRFGSFCCKLPFLTLSPISPFPSCEQHALLTEEPLDPWGSVGRQTRLDKSHIDIAAAMKLFQ